MVASHATRVMLIGMVSYIYWMIETQKILCMIHSNKILENIILSSIILMIQYYNIYGVTTR